MVGPSLKMSRKFCEDRGCKNMRICSGRVFSLHFLYGWHEKWCVELAKRYFVRLVIFKKNTWIPGLL